MRKRIRSCVAVLLSLMLVFQLCDGAIVWAAEDPTANITLTTPEDLKDGNWFFITQTEWTVSEKSTERLYIPIQRTGGLDKEASVDLKLVDMTSHAGVNYTASIYKEDAETETVFDGEALVDIIAEPDDQGEIDKEAYAEASREVLDQGGVITDTEDNVVGGVITAEGLEAETQGQQAESGQAGPAEAGETPAGTRSAAAENAGDPSGQESSANLLAYPSNPLRQARNEYAGTASDRQDIVGDRNWINHSTAETYSGSDAALVSEDYPGTIYHLEFAAGESVKYLVIEPKYSDKAEGDSTLMLMLGSPSDGYLVPEFCSVTNVTITDEDPPEEVVVSIQDTQVYAMNGKARITVTRTGRVNDLVTVMISTQEGSGVTGQNFSGVGAKLYFPMGLNSRTVEIPVNHDTTEKDFYVTITPVTDCSIGHEKVRVVIPAVNDEASLMEDDSKGFPLDDNIYTNDRVHVVSYGDAWGSRSQGLKVNSGSSSAIMMISLNPRQTSWDSEQDYTYFYDGVMLDWDQETGWFSEGDNHLYLSTDLNTLYAATGFGNMGNNHLNAPFTVSGGTLYDIHFGNDDEDEFTRRDYLFFWDNEYNTEYGFMHNDFEKGRNCRSINIINNSDRNWRNTVVNAVQPIQRNFHFDLQEAQLLELRGVSDEEQRRMETVKINSSMTDTSVDVLGGGSFAVTAANQKYLRFKAVEAVMDVKGKEVTRTIAEVPKGSNTVVIDVTMDLVDELCYNGFCTLQPNRKMQDKIDSLPMDDGRGYFAKGESYQGVIKIRPVFERIPVTVDVASGTYGAFKGLETGEQEWYMGENLTLTTQLNEKGQAAGVEPTGVALQRRWSKSGEYIAKYDDYYLDGKLTATYKVDCPYMRVEPTFSAVGNSVPVKISSADRELFDQTKGLFAGQTPVYDPDEDVYTYTLADNVKISQVVNLLAVPRDLNMVPVWTTSRDDTRYSGYSFVLRAGSTAEENALTLTVSKEGNPYYALSGALYADELNLNTGGLTGVLSPAGQAMVSAGVSGVYSGDDGTFTVPAQRFVPGTSIRWSVTYNGGVEIQECGLPSAGAPTAPATAADGSSVSAVMLDVGMKKIPNWSGLNAHFTGSYVTQSGVYVVGTSVLEMNGSKTVLSAEVDSGVGYVDQNGNQKTETVTGVTFSFRDPRTGQTRSEQPAVYNPESKTWQADLGNFSPDDMEGTCTFGDLLYVQMTTDRDLTGDGGPTVYAPVSTGYSVISSQNIKSGGTFEMSLPFDELMASFTGGAGLSDDGTHTSANFKSLPFLGEIKTFIGVARTSTRAWKAIAARGEKDTADMIRDDLDDLADDSYLEGDDGGAALMGDVVAGGVMFNLIIDFKELPYGGTRVLLGALISVGNTPYQHATNPLGNLTQVLSGSALRADDQEYIDYNNMQQIGDEGIVRIQDDDTPSLPLSASMKSNKNWMGGWYFAFGIYAGVYMDFGLLSKTTTTAEGQKTTTTDFKVMGAGGFTGIMGKAGGVVPCAVFPIYFGIEGKADVKAFFGLTDDPGVTLEQFRNGEEINANEWNFNMDTDATVKGMGYVGLGIPGLLGVKASVGVQIRFTSSNKIPQWFPNNPDMAEGKGMGTDAIFEGTVDLVLISLPLFTYSYPLPLESGTVPYFREVKISRKTESIITGALDNAIATGQLSADSEVASKLRSLLWELDDVISDSGHSSWNPIAEKRLEVQNYALKYNVITMEQYKDCTWEGRAGGIISYLLSDESGKPEHDYYVPDYDASRWVANDGASLMASFQQSESRTILEATVNQPEPKLLDLGNNKVLMAFLDVDAGRPAGQQSVLKVSVLNTGTGRWTEPIVIQDDGTGDYAPDLCDCGDDGVMLSWISTAPEKVKEEEDPLDTLAQLDVFSVMLNGDGEVTGEVEQLTNDNIRDYNPQGIYDPSTGDRMVMYIKTAPDTEYQAESDAQKFFDYGNPYAANKMYSVIGYMLYNNQTEAEDNNGKTHEAGWAKDYYFMNEKETIDPSFLEQWGGQRFLVSPIKDENGDLDQEDPAIGDLTTCIAKNGMASFAYTVDTDMDGSTWGDKDLFVQFYDFQEHSVYVPVRLTKDNVSKSNPQLVRSGDATRLFFLNDMDSLYYLNITQILNAKVPASKEDQTQVYALQNDGTFYGGYSPSFHMVDTSNGSGTGELGKLTGYTAYVDGDDNLYVVYPATVRYTNEKGRDQYAQEIFATGFIDEGFKGEGKGGAPCWSKPAQLTTGNKCNSEPAVTTDSAGNLILVHNQYDMIDRSDDEAWLAENAVEVVETDAGGNETVVTKAPFFEVTPTSLVLTKCAPVGSLACTRVVYSDDTPKPGDEITVNALLENTGLTSVRKGKVKVYEYVDGVKGDEINGGSYDVEKLMQPGISAEYSFKWQVPEDEQTLAKTALLFEITEYDKDGGKYDTLKFVNGSFTLETDLSARVESIEQQGDEYKVKYSVTNNGNIAADPMYVRLSLQGLYGDLQMDYGVSEPELCGEDLETLAPGKTKTYIKTVTVPVSVFEKCGFDAVAPELSDPKNHDSVFLAGKGQYITQEEPFHVKINDGKAIALTPGQSRDLSVSYELNAVADQGTTTVWTVSNPAVATVQDGKLVALGKGITILTAAVMPYGTSEQVLVTVTDGSSGGEGGGADQTENLIEIPASVDHGTITSSVDKAGAGEKVTLTVTPDKGYELSSITVTDAKGKEVPVTKNADGTYSFTMPDSAVRVNPTFVKEGQHPDSANCPKDATCPISKFSDAKPKDWYHDGVHWALDEGIMKGTGETTFEPGGSATRAMVVTMLWRMAGEPAGGTAAPFTDVKAGSWYADAVNWAAKNNVVNGTSKTTFSPDTPVTREQLAAILYRYAQSKGKGFKGNWTFSLDFSDAAKVSEYAREAMCWMTMNGIITGMGDGTLAPGDNATRAQIATMFMRFAGVMEK